MVVRVRVGYSGSSTAAEGVEEGGRRKRRQCTRGEERRVERDSVLDPPGDRCVRLPERRAETPASFLFSLRCFSLSLSPLYRFPYKRAQFRVPAHYSSLFFSASSSFELSLQSPTSEFSRSLTHSSCFCQCHRRSFRFEPLDVGGAAATHTPSTALHNACKHPPALNLRLRSFFPSSLFFLLSTSFVFVDDVLYYCVRVFNTFLSVYLRPLLPPPPLRYRRRRPTAASSPFLYNLPPTLFAPPPLPRVHRRRPSAPVVPSFRVARSPHDSMPLLPLLLLLLPVALALRRYIRALARHAFNPLLPPTANKPSLSQSKNELGYPKSSFSLSPKPEGYILYTFRLSYLRFRSPDFTRYLASSLNLHTQTSLLHPLVPTKT